VISYYFCDEENKHRRLLCQTATTDSVKIEALKLLTVILTRDSSLLLAAQE